ncbi:MAG: histidine phosphatase family protein [Gammaproteobacteria bacterium]|nr:histidine phosphatase family protein [Gammaproteobacteria bacterium]
MTEYRQQKFQRPPGATEILLVRHGESRAATADNPFPLVDGHGDPELHPEGREQAARVGHRLKHQPISAIYVSNLRRTHETAQPLAEHLSLTPITDPDLREVYLGEWEGGLLRIKAHDNDPIYLRMHTEQRWDVIPGAESHTELNERLLRALNRIADQHADELVVAVVHGGVIAHILAHASGANHFAFNGADNGSISHIIMLDGRIMVRRFNDSSHLTEAISAAESQMT